MGFSRGFKKQADDTALRVRRDLGLGDEDPINPFALCEFLKVPTFSLTGLKQIGLDSKAFEQLYCTFSNRFSAATIYKGDRKIIVYNDSHDFGRINFSLCHELAHVICAHEHGTFNKEYPNILLREFPKDQEDEADWLGSCILIPKDALFKACFKKLSLPQIAEHFGASESLARMRINKSGVSTVFARTGRSMSFLE